MGPPCLPEAPSSSHPSGFQSPWEETRNDPQHEEVPRARLSSPVGRPSEHVCAFCVYPPRWGLASLEEKRDISQLCPHSEPSWAPVLTLPPQPRPLCLSTPHLSQSTLARASLGIRGTRAAMLQVTPTGPHPRLL